MKAKSKVKERLSDDEGDNAVARSKIEVLLPSTGGEVDSD